MKRAIAFACSLFLALALTVPASAEGRSALSHGSREEKLIALTFDDGPHPRYTPKILELLDKYKLKATFFMIGSNARLYPDTARAVKAAGHEIGNHTYKHPHMLRIGEGELYKEIKETECVFSEIGLDKPTLFRPPEGYRTKEQCSLLEKEGYHVVVWSLDTHDWKGTSAEEIVRYVTSNVKGGDIILFHDYISGQNTTIAALEQLIPRLLKDGYKFVSVSELCL